MVGLGTIFIAVLGAGGVPALARARSSRARWFLWILMLADAVPLHRQPGRLDGGRGRAASRGSSTACSGPRRRPRPNVSGGMTFFTLLGFMGLYALLGLLYLFLVLRIVDAGPAAGRAAEPEPDA